MNVIQIGISIANEKGEVPLPCNTWQFNFKYDLRFLKLIDSLKKIKKVMKSICLKRFRY